LGGAPLGGLAFTTDSIFEFSMNPKSRTKHITASMESTQENNANFRSLPVLTLPGRPESLPHLLQHADEAEGEF